MAAIDDEFGEGNNFGRPPGGWLDTDAEFDRIDAEFRSKSDAQHDTENTKALADFLAMESTEDVFLNGDHSVALDPEYENATEATASAAPEMAHQDTNDTASPVTPTEPPSAAPQENSSAPETGTNPGTPETTEPTPEARRPTSFEDSLAKINLDQSRVPVADNYDDPGYSGGNTNRPTGIDFRD